MAGGVDGLALGAVLAGSAFLYAAFTGKSVLKSVQAVVQGKTPAATPAANPISGSVSGAPASQGSSAPGQVTNPASQSESAWISALLSNIGAPQTQANVSSITSWIQHETPWPPVAANNPLNTTYSMPGATDYNSVGVKNYPSASEGMRATVATLQGGQYNDILMLLKSGQGLCGHTLQGLSTWSGGGYSSIC